MVNKLIPSVLDVVQSVVNEFRQGLLKLMQVHWREEVCSKKELLLIDKAKATVNAIIKSSKLKALDSDDPLVTIKIGHLDGDKLVTGIAESVVDEHMEELATFECLKICRESSKNFHAKGGVMKLVKEVNGHSFYYLHQRDLKVPGFKHREWRSVAKRRQRLDWRGGTCTVYNSICSFRLLISVVKLLFAIAPPWSLSTLACSLVRLESKISLVERSSSITFDDSWSFASES